MNAARHVDNCHPTNPGHPLSYPSTPRTPRTLRWVEMHEAVVEERRLELGIEDPRHFISSVTLLVRRIFKKRGTLVAQTRRLGLLLPLLVPKLSTVCQDLGRKTPVPMQLPLVVVPTTHWLVLASWRLTDIVLGGRHFFQKCRGPPIVRNLEQEDWAERSIRDRIDTGQRRR